MFTVCRGKIWTPSRIVRVFSLGLLASLSLTPSARAAEENSPRDRQPDLRAWRELQDRFDRWRRDDRTSERRNDLRRSADAPARERGDDSFRSPRIDRGGFGPGGAFARRGSPIGRGPQISRRDLPPW